MKKVWSLFVVIGLTVWAIADAVGPLGSAMHKMSGALQCIEGKMPSFMCKGDNFGNFKVGSKQARESLLSVAKAPDKKKMIVMLFDGLDSQIVEAESAVRTKNKLAFDAAIAKIHEIMNAGHTQFASAGRH